MSQAKSLLEMLGAEESVCHLSKSAVIVIDAQKEYLYGKVKLSGIEKALDEIEVLLRRARQNSTPVFHLVHHAPKGAPIFDPDSEMVEIIDQASPEAGEPVISKSLPSGFVGTNLDQILKKTGRNNLIIAGFMTHMCVNATTRSALDLGYSPTIIDSCCATRDLPLHGSSTEFVPAKVIHSSNLASLADLVSGILPAVSDLED